MFIFVQLARAAWKDIEVFGQLNNFNLKPINILLQFELRKIFSTLNKRREQHLLSVEATCRTFSSVKSQSPRGTTAALREKSGMKSSAQTLVCSLMFRIFASMSSCVFFAVMFLCR